MRRVLRSNADVAHVWAQQVQDEERSGNMFFEGDTIYSYGHHFPIARFVKKDVVLFNSNSYSITTSGHQGIVRSAIPRYIKVFEVPRLYGGWYRSTPLEREDHLVNLEYYMTKFTESMRKAKRARLYTNTHLREAINYVDTFRDYVDTFRIKSKLPAKLRRFYNTDTGNIVKAAKEEGEHREERVERADETHPRGTRQMAARRANSSTRERSSLSRQAPHQG